MSDHHPGAHGASPLQPIELTAVEARIIGCLMEKQRTTPEQYPLTLNALANACNQKSSRHPLMQLSLGEVGHTVNQLRDRGLVHAGTSGRTERYDHKMVGTYHLSREEQAVLTVLMLRGPQTLGEIRINTGRMAEFADLAAVSATLEALIERGPALVMELPRSPGRREERFAHLLCGTPTLTDLGPLAEPSPGGPSGGHGTSRVEALAAEVARLRADLDRLYALTGYERTEDPSADEPEGDDGA